MLKITMIATVLMSSMAIAQAEVSNMKKETSYITEYAYSIIPENFTRTISRKVHHNEIQVELSRYQEHGGEINYSGGNVSTLVSESGQLIGLSRLLPNYEFNNNNVDEDEARKIAMTFLNQHASDLLQNFKIQWIKNHDEVIYESGKKIVISGMKVKCRNLMDGLYFWVIVAPNKDVIVFERDIEWDFIRAGRQTEKWLHDDWLVKNI